ncbi:histidine kinase [Burkholderia cenocepacia]|uniref:histidine kinase n=1 Tax=Burkholderia cenocepacia TaxID=95486 RepID=UPI0009B21ABA|nr:histidine kinase [Burkholderia cenocepacia]MBR7945076.1 histidine kinase [Burkholderia cenocepacia]MBR8351410.1 histidine kinase [Burkholderia cenocepacia]MCW3606308.1 histidine kinase [Burkholderia cenocepacia]MCW3686919.1 histidine kinase [Burkholderia cenocepacia]MCW5187251.1 histidine kinase [Burkholderia cenocepacia]
MHGIYNLPLVLLSLAIATLASYTTLDLAAFISLLDNPKLKRAWLGGGAAAMGTGIWSMHFVGMLAFSLPVPLGYAWQETGASLAIAVLVSYFALNVVTRARLGWRRLCAGGVLMGGGIAGMHYTGMAALHMQPGIRYDAALFAASIGIAVVASTAALWIAQALRMQQARHATAQRIGAAVIMGIAITGMHYTAMAAAHFAPDARCGAANGVDAPWLATTVALFTMATLVVTLLVCRFDARTTFLRGMTDTLERLVRVRTSELERALHSYEQTTQMLQRTRENMATEIDERKAAHALLEQEKDEQRRLLHALEETHEQLLQSEKLASIGQLAAGVAHEINNPIGFVSANLNTLKTWVRSLLDVVAAHEAALPQLDPATRDALTAAHRAADLDYVRDEIATLIDESIDGALRVRRIVQDLRDFSRPASDEWSVVDLHAGLESTLNVVHNELKYKADIVRDYGDVPHVECLPSQLNQVFMNLLVNAAQAIPERGVITIRTSSDGEQVSIAISDTGAGMTPDVVRRIFDPFFTTKPVGQGTGLGLSVSHGIVERHRGAIDVTSEPGRGTTFRIRLPVRRAGDRADAAALEQRV